jgi:hypothetical protein
MTSGGASAQDAVTSALSRLDGRQTRERAPHSVAAQQPAANPKGGGPSIASKWPPTQGARELI